jgi:hypothetical protein
VRAMNRMLLSLPFDLMLMKAIFSHAPQEHHGHSSQQPAEYFNVTPHYAPPSGPPPFDPSSGQPYAPQHQHYAPPSGPPPFDPSSGQPYAPQHQHYVPPSGPPPFDPSSGQPYAPQHQHYAPPSGPPPTAYSATDQGTKRFQQGMNIYSN